MHKRPLIFGMLVMLEFIFGLVRLTTWISIVSDMCLQRVSVASAKHFHHFPCLFFIDKSQPLGSKHAQQ